MQIKTALFIALAITIGCTSAENATYIGCYVDCNGDCSVATDRDLPVYFCSNGKFGADCASDPSLSDSHAGANVMTPQFCSGLCNGFKFFGIQYGAQCFCGNDYGNQGGKSPESDCSVPCPGDTSLSCGGAERNSIYAQPPSMYQTNSATISSH
jgi:hypothetical protein